MKSHEGSIRLTLHMARSARAAGQRPIEVIGSLPEEESKSVHEGFW